MKDNEDEQVNDTHIICFCKRAAIDVLNTTSIPLNSTPLTSVTATDRLLTMNSRDPSHADCQVGAWNFFSGQTVKKLGKLFPREGSQ